MKTSMQYPIPFLKSIQKIKREILSHAIRHLEKILSQKFKKHTALDPYLRDKKKEQRIFQ